MQNTDRTAASREQAKLYKRDFIVHGAVVPKVEADEPCMQVAKLDDQLRSMKALRASLAADMEP